MASGCIVLYSVVKNMLFSGNTGGSAVIEISSLSISWREYVEKYLDFVLDTHRFFFDNSYFQVLKYTKKG